jgi:hypothetical protein
MQNPDISYKDAQYLDAENGNTLFLYGYKSCIKRKNRHGISGESRMGKNRDVRLGFCYDPLAGLGIKYVNSGCSTEANGTRCQ